MRMIFNGTEFWLASVFILATWESEKVRKAAEKHAIGICNYAKYKLTGARIEAGNISIGMIRKQARGIKYTDYFNLKIRQSLLPDDQLMFYI